jgi:CheY-like chemotaxis protein
MWRESRVAKADPPEENAPAEAAPAEPEAAASGARPHRLLTIEDNVWNVRLVERIVSRRPGLELTVAMLGKLGIDLAREHRPDVILLDLHLPDMPGREVLRLLRSYPETRDIPVIVVSGDATRSQIERLEEDGAAGYVTKPLEVANFLDVIESVLARTGAKRA